MLSGRVERAVSTKDAILRLKSGVGEDLAATSFWRWVSSLRRVGFGAGVDILLLGVVFSTCIVVLVREAFGSRSIVNLNHRARKNTELYDVTKLDVSQ
jgi:hypothetical protein